MLVVIGIRLKSDAWDRVGLDGLGFLDYSWTRSLHFVDYDCIIILSTHNLEYRV